MSRRVAVALGVFLGGFGVLASATFSLNQSLWFLWESVPPGDLRLAYDQQQPASPLLTPYLQSWLGPDLNLLFEDSAQLAISRRADGVVASVLPRHAWSPRVQRAFTRQLRAEGWHTRRLGLAIVASYGANSQRLPASPPARRFGGPDWRDGRLARGTFAALRDLLTARQPREPLFIATVTDGSPPFMTPPFSLIAASEENELTIVAAQGTYLPSLSHASLALADTVGSSGAADLSVALPSELFNQLPRELAVAWHNLLRQYLNFEHTDPGLLAAAVQSKGGLTIKLIGDSAVLGVETGGAQFAAAARASLEAEEAYLRPSRRAFRLPDKSIGFELVPGEPQDLFSNKLMGDGCQPALSLWLCEAGDRASLANDQGLAEAALRSEPRHVLLREKYARSLPLPLAAFAATATADGNIVIQAKLVADKGVH